jgi:hypothetical protein
MLWLFFKFVQIVIFLSLPFIMLIRVSLAVNAYYGGAPWLSLLAGAGATAIVLWIYIILIYTNLSNGMSSWVGFKTKGYLAGLITIGFLVQGIFFFSSANVKSFAIKTELRETHPILRAALSTVVIIDKNLIVTDASRVSSDYHKMGLPRNERSQHKIQKDGYAHAIDLRTNNRNELRNFLLRTYFRVMGFNTMRHVGTDDHLHIGMP